MADQRLLEIFIECASIEGLSQREKPVATYIKKFLSAIGEKIISDNSGKYSGSNTGNLIWKHGSGGNFILLSHMDTARSTKNLKTVFKKDRITSDGKTVLGVDNRAGIAVLLRLIEKIIKEKISVNDFTIAFTTCEETSLGGSKNLELNGEIKYGFVFDSYLRPGAFINESIGAASFDVLITGKAAHSGIAPEKGINAIMIASEAISQIKIGSLDQHSSVNIGLISGGSAVNVIPESTFVRGEVRSNKNDVLKKILEEINNIFQRTAKKFGGSSEFHYNWDFKPYLIKETDDIYKIITGTLKTVGLKPKPSISKGGSDANSLNERHIHAVNLGIGAQNPHSNEEFILFEDLNKSLEIAYQLVKV